MSLRITAQASAYIEVGNIRLALVDALLTFFRECGHGLEITILMAITSKLLSLVAVAFSLR
jgi:hypothetical protein